MSMNYREKHIAQRSFLLGAIIAFILTAITGLLLYDTDNELTRAEMQRRLDGYRLCMQSAGAMRCQMTPEDFIDYYDLQYRILQLTGPP